MFSERLRQIRKDRGFTLDSLAELYNQRYGAGLNKSTLSKYENGKQEPLISVINNLSSLLNVSADYLLGKTQNRIESLRKVKGDSIEDIAKLLSATANEIEQFENGIKYPNKNQLEILSKYFNRPAKFITGESNSPSFVPNYMKEPNTALVMTRGQEGITIIKNETSKEKTIKIPEEKTYMIVTEEEKEFLTPILENLRKLKNK